MKSQLTMKTRALMSVWLPLLMAMTICACDHDSEMVDEPTPAEAQDTVVQVPADTTVEVLLYDAVYYPADCTWTMERTNLMDKSVHDTLHFSIGKDTVIQARQYHVILVDGEACGTYVRELGEQVFQYSDLYGIDYLHYDFDWHVGEEMPYTLYLDGTSMPRGKITEIHRMTLADGKEYDYVDFDVWPFRIIRHVGRPAIDLLDWIYDFPLNGDRYRLLTFSRGGVLIYDDRQPGN